MKKTVQILSALLLVSLNLNYAQENDTLNIDMLLLKGKYQTIINYYEQDKEKIFDAKEYYSIGLAFQQMFKNDFAAQMFMKASRLDSHNPTYLYMFAKCLISAGNTMYAQGTLKEVLEKDSSNINAKIELALLTIDNRQFYEAKRLLTELIEHDSTNAFFYQKLGFAELKVGNKKKAIELYEKSLSLNSNNALTRFQLASIYFKEENFEKSFMLVKEGLSHHARNLPLHRLAAESLFKLKKYNSCITQFEYLISMGDSTASNLQKLGFSYYFSSSSLSENDSIYKTEFLNLAIENLQKSFDLNNQDPLTSLYLGICHKDLGDYNIAIASLEHTVNLLFPTYTSDVFTHLGASYELNKNFSKAIDAYAEAYRFDSTKKILLFSLASTMDQYYEDRETPLMYYKSFLNSYEGDDQKLVEFANSRMESLIEKNHFRNGR